VQITHLMIPERRAKHKKSPLEAIFLHEISETMTRLWISLHNFFLFAFNTRENRDSQLGLIDTHTYSLIKISCKKILSKVHNMQYFTVRIGVFRDVAYLGSHPRGFPYVDIHITFSS
jgi:hypothetical protein